MGYPRPSDEPYGGTLHRRSQPSHQLNQRGQVPENLLQHRIVPQEDSFSQVCPGGAVLSGGRRAIRRLRTPGRFVVMQPNVVPIGSQQSRVVGENVEPCDFDALTARDGGACHSPGGSEWTEPLLPFPLGVPPQSGLRRLKVHQPFGFRRPVHCRGRRRGPDSPGADASPGRP